ncbi:MAG TPA: hypothetical protein DD381_09915 [Lentisphaeria bacterium]|nr:MAG: hypothetical protein A2X47_09860 [Lentisphaerae bacterium GWF2_38_69]HBM16640.1 hypothetical protein [Lentisphaeria bacterium]
MKINIVFFTSTGNTLYLALRAKYFFEKAGHRIGLFDVVNSRYDEIISCDALGIFYPVWMSNMPDHLQVFCNLLLKEQNKKDLFIIGNCATGADTSPNFWKNKLIKSGHRVHYTAILKMPSNCNISVLAKDTSESQISDFKKDSVNKLQEICKDLLSDVNKYLPGAGISNLYALQRFFFFLKNKFAYKYLRLVNHRCSRCYLCVRLCPVNNIKLGYDNFISFGEKCILCAKCFNFCPEKAICIGKKSEDFQKYRRYVCKEVKPLFYR